MAVICSAANLLVMQHWGLLTPW